MPLDDPALISGFHEVEDDGGRRWTDGDAAVDRQVLTRFPGDLVLSIRGGFQDAGS